MAPAVDAQIRCAGGVLRELADLAVPVSCAGCGSSSVALCPACRTALRRIGRARSAAAQPDPTPPGMPQAWALTAYDDVIRQVVVAHKDDGRVALRSELARLWRVALAGAVEADIGLRAAVRRTAVLVVPVPSSPASVRARGRDPWREVVTEALGAEPRLPVVRALMLRRAVRDQAGLGAAARAANLREAMAVRRRVDLRGHTVVVADDVMTTGSTLTEAARAVRAAGAGDVRAVVIAATARRATTAG